MAKYTINRCNFLKLFGLTILASHLPGAAQNNLSPSSIIKPSRLKVGDTVGLISPAGFVESETVNELTKILSEIGLKVKRGKHILDRYGYLAGKDCDRAADVNAMFADTSVAGIFTMAGGWGCNRILPLLDYNLIRQNPKILMGFSDVTSLILAIYTKTGIVTFHGPLGTSTWNSFSVKHLQDVLFNGQANILKNVPNTPVETITTGKVRGHLVGGNLSLVTALVGSGYLPDWEGKILFVEEVREDIYRIDRMLNQLKLSGILDKIAGFIFAQCTKCTAGEDNQPSLTLQEVFSDCIEPLGIPAWYGSMIGHIPDKFTLPLGVEVEIDADLGTIQMLESAVI
ncbi:MAG TPA: LD-carboxypeptidase [Cyanobacteria bacterium UBA11149]|nr:LD-carboxypeptidase [Cyanobacteria bacterium UBA11367]HBE57072.1 LD-carboxypeptidase [Cyanobacteria bacterium UBA11366]HBK62816.1 LD-carboxypeptidase [Cyanobacteria bacterium UBA11166]HBR74472.1 LD-carboxypeptidase [Cyanobacteria bacterium UBA11159]HBS70122.1 LD-carboxypeptidase [Cyanobacteria bacterium UBA11153]HBW91440.1 LD-carboxypeptidase [Cyanobacteria bacterium UBA11149]HCA95559.1 LD-carboxypeptidase [Cyanobacteria bacterium UBA9226]